MAIYIYDRIEKEGEESLFTLGAPVQVSIPYRIGKDIPIDCECGYMLETNYKLTDLWCPNPYCFVSNSYKVVKVFEKSNQKINIGQKTAQEILKHNGFYRHMDLFTISQRKQFPNSNSDRVKDKWIADLKEFRKGRDFGEYVEFFQFDGLGKTKCAYLFAGIGSVSQLEDKLNNEVDFRQEIAKKLGYVNAGGGPVTGVLNTIRNGLPLLKYYEPYFSPFNREEGNVIFISLTGRFSRFSPRSNLIDWVKENFKVNPVLVKYSGKSDVLVYEEDIQSTQFKQAQRDGKAVKLDEFLKTIEHLRKEEESHE